MSTSGEIHKVHGDQQPKFTSVSGTEGYIRPTCEAYIFEDELLAKNLFGCMPFNYNSILTFQNCKYGILIIPVFVPPYLVYWSLEEVNICLITSLKKVSSSQVTLTFSNLTSTVFATLSISLSASDRRERDTRSAWRPSSCTFAFGRSQVRIIFMSVRRSSASCAYKGQ